MWATRPKAPAEGAAAWAQYQYDKGNPNYALDADNAACGGRGAWKCNCFVKDAFKNGGGVADGKLPKHYVNGKKGKYFAMANELGNKSLNTDVLGIGDGSIGNIVAWPRSGDSGHSGIIGCDGKIYSATKDGLQRWNRGWIWSLTQIIRYKWITGREKVYRSCCGK